MPDNDSGRFMKELMFDVPRNGLLTREEQMLRELSKQTKMMEETHRQYDSNSPGFQLLPPEVNIDYTGMARELSPYLDNTIQAQQELAHRVEDLGMQGQQALEEAQAQTELLSSLDEYSQAAYEQRNLALDELVRHSEQLGFISRGVQKGIEQRDDANRMSYVALQQRQVGLEQLNRMNQGIDALNSNMERGFGNLGNLVVNAGKNITRLLGNLGTDIQGINTEMVQTRIQILASLTHFKDMFLWSHREQYMVQQQVLDVLSNPMRTQALEAWRIGEQCRIAGDLKKAKAMFKRSLDINPAEVRSHISLGMLHFTMGNMGKAKKRLEGGVQYAHGQSSLRSTALLYLGKMEVLDKNTSGARSLLEEGMESDVQNVAIWYELAVTEMQGNNAENALYYLKNIIDLRVKYGALHAKKYEIKMLADPVFTSLLPQLFNLQGYGKS